MTRPESAPPPAAGRVILATRFDPPGRGPARPRFDWPWRAILISLALLAWALAAWFVFTARAVTLTTTPADAELSVTDWFAPRLGNHWLLRAGDHRVRARAPGYHPYDDVITVGDAQIQTVTVALERLPGHLRIALAPPNVTAEVSIDDARAGQAPGVIRAVAAGPRAVEVAAPRYRRWFGQVEVEGKDIEQTVQVALEPAWADYALDTQPRGALFSIDGVKVGATPLAGEIIEGRRTLRLEKPGYKPWQQVLNVTAGTSLKLGTVVLVEADGELVLESTPPGASVTLDDAYVGRTPLTLAVAPGKAHRLRVMAEGYVATERGVTLTAAARETLQLTLDAELGDVEFQATPPDAELLIDGAPRGSANQRLSLPTREHEVSVRARGYATWQARITPRKDITKRYTLRLRTIAEAGAEAMPETAAAAPAAPAPDAAPAQPQAQAPTQMQSDDGAAQPATSSVTTSLGQVLRLFTGGSARLGAGRSDGARRADEIEREVLLQRPFYLGAREVTNGEFRRFLGTHHVAPVGGKPLDDDLQPVVEIDWRMAAQYCNWLSRRDGLPVFYQIRYGEVLGVNPAATGYRLPTEAEWEWAARGAGRGAGRAYAWGDRFPPVERSGNYADASAAGLVGEVLRNFNDGYAAAAPVGSFAADGPGLYDLGGNVAEWVHDYYQAAPPATRTIDPLGPAGGAEHVIKGASWARATQTDLRLARRDAGARGRNDVGFRLARYAQ